MRPEDVRWKAHPKCKRPHDMWSAKDDQATEVEVTDFIRSLVKLTKPKVIIETGTYEGQTTEAIISAVLENRDVEAHVSTYETDEDRALSASDKFSNLNIPIKVSVVPKAIRAGNCPKDIDFAFLDSDMRSRSSDMAAVWPNMAPGGIVVVHDASPLRPPGEVRPPKPYNMFDIATPRGLLIFQKPW